MGQFLFFLDLIKKRGFRKLCRYRRLIDDGVT
jgi:hypothetical protein